MTTRNASVFAVGALIFALAGCGGGGDSSSDPASVVPAGAPVFIEAKLQPEAKIAANVEALAKQVAGIDNLGETIVEKLESSVDPGEEPLDFGKEIEPWLGEKAGLYIEGYDGDEFETGGVAIETTDSGAAEEFLEKRVESGDEKVKSDSYEGVDYFAGTGEEAGKTYGVDGDFILYGETEKAFKEMVDAAKGESLADQDTFSSATADAPSGSLADIFVDIGGLIEEAGNNIDAESQVFLDTVGIDPKDATAELSLVPGAEQVEIDLTSNVTGKNPQGGDASKLLESLPGGSFAALAAPDFGKQLGEAIDRLDAQGIPGELEPNELKSSLEAAGIDLDQIAASIGGIGVFAQGNTEANLGGSVVLETTNAKEATNTVANIGLLLRASGTAGVTAVNGQVSGFSIRADNLGPQPIVVAAKGERIAIAYGLAAAVQALNAGQSATLGQNPEFKEAVAALGDTPISGFVAGPAALQVARQMLLSSEQSEGFEEAEPYLEKIGYVGIGATAAGELTTAKLIVGLTK
jgi:hypothetical protein